MYVLIHANDGITFRSDKHFCWMDGYAAFRKGELLSGRLGKTIVYLHTYVHTYIHTYVHTYIHAYVYTYMCKHVFIFVYIKLHCVMYIHTYTFEDACTNIRSYVHTYKHTNILVFILGKKTLGGDTKPPTEPRAVEAAYSYFFKTALPTTISSSIYATKPPAKQTA